MLIMLRKTTAVARIAWFLSLLFYEYTNLISIVIVRSYDLGDHSYTMPCRLIAYLCIRRLLQSLLCSLVVTTTYYLLVNLAHVAI
ncbi:hypothetical protein F4781DRAFT_395745 [Annulohypoxylon bovei var. microspora]|nr:hypothetical protein F4781DRAFT_395745 [Annulohypoxylon bovei var. microspora]